MAIKFLGGLITAIRAVWNPSCCPDTIFRAAELYSGCTVPYITILRFPALVMKNKSICLLPQPSSRIPRQHLGAVFSPDAL